MPYHYCAVQVEAGCITCVLNGRASQTELPKTHTQPPKYITADNPVVLIQWCSLLLLQTIPIQTLCRKATFSKEDTF